jgi:hypothetical protein
MKKVFTYYEPVSQLKRQLEQLDVCRQSWERNGWQLEVLGESVAKGSAFYAQYVEALTGLPTVNPGKYDYHCYMRWLAMAEIGGGIMIDYDVVNLSLMQPDVFEPSAIAVHCGYVPCTVSGSAENYLRVCREFCDLAKRPWHFIEILGKPHTSDMVMLATGLIQFNEKYTVTEYPVPGQLIHCNTDACNLAKKPKLEIMKSLLGT